MAHYRAARVKKEAYRRLSELVYTREKMLDKKLDICLYTARLPSVPTIRTWPAKLTFFLLLRHHVLSCGAKRALHAVAFSLSRVSGVTKERKKEIKLRKTTTNNLDRIEQSHPFRVINLIKKKFFSWKI